MAIKKGDRVRVVRGHKPDDARDWCGYVEDIREENVLVELVHAQQKTWFDAERILPMPRV